MRFAVLSLWLTCGAVSAQAMDARIWVDVKINNQPVKFVFDTGAGGTVLFEHAAKRLNIKSTPPPETVVVAAGAMSYRVSEPVELTILSQTFPDVQVAVVSALFPNVDGMIGWPNLRNNRFYLSGQNLRFRIVPESQRPTEIESWLMLKEVPENPVLLFELPGHTAEKPSFLGIDTGSPHGLRLAPEAWKQWRTNHPDAPQTLVAYVMTVQGLIVAEEAWAARIDLNGLEFHDIPVGPMNTQEMQTYPVGTMAIAGLEALRRIDAYFDGKAHTLFAKPLDIPPPSYVHNMIGAVFTPVKMDSDYLVAQVIDASPAAEAGIRNGDILLKIDALDVTPWRTAPGILPLSRFFAQAPGTELQLTVRRGNETMVIPVTLQTILGPSNSD